MAFIITTGLLCGTLTCGWACPVGFIQDILHAPRLKEIRVTNKLKVFKYFALLLGILAIFFELRFNFLSKRGIGVFHEVTIIGGGLLLATAIFVKRPFCRMLCPLGFIYGKLNKISPIKVALDKNKCLACGRCNSVCVADIRPVEEANGDLCAKCFNCAKVCSRKDFSRAY
ncbi:MAG: 4Fe-4S binding protein [Deltaproteobacteria bacterium]